METEWINEEENVASDIQDPDEWRETPGRGLVLVISKQRVKTRHKHKKMIAIGPNVRQMLNDAIVGSQVAAIEVLLEYALTKLAAEEKNLEV